MKSDPRAGTGSAHGDGVAGGRPRHKRNGEALAALDHKIGVLRRQVIANAERLAGIEERMARQYSELAGLHPDRAEQYRRIARNAQANAEHAHEVVRYLSDAA